MTIKRYNNEEHRDKIISLWKEVFGYTQKRNDPGLSIDNKLKVDDLLFVAMESNKVIGSIMVGYDGHRGWIYSLAVDQLHRKQGVGSALMDRAEKELMDRGCVKINLQILPDNSAVKEFYKSRGYNVEERISMGKQTLSSDNRG